MNNNINLEEVKALHAKHLRGEDGGERADLRDADLSGAYLREADLSGADLRDADLSRADLRGADLRGAYLRGADLHGAYLREADLSGADLRDADLSGADLRGADLRGAYLRGADLRGADLRGAYLDFASWPLHCGGTKAKLDRHLSLQLLYHTFNQQHLDPEVTAALEPLRALAQEFITKHRSDATTLRS